MTIKGDVLIESKSLRESVIDRVDILEKIKKLETLPDDIHLTGDMVANFYEVSNDVIRQTAVRKKDELESDGMRTIQGKELSDMKSLCGLNRNIGKLTLYTRRSVLRIGMLLQESHVAQILRDRLLDIQEETVSSNIIQIPTELNLLGQLSDAINQSYKAMIQFQTQLVATNEKANEAARQAEEAKAKNRELENEINDMRRGLVDVEIPLRTQFNDSVRKYAKRHSLEWDEAYNNVYATLGKQNHVDLKRRLKNRQDNGDKVKMIDIIEELNLLVPAIRLAKTMAGVAS
jgi:hypothetical protein